MTHRSYKLQCRKGRLRECSDGEMICQTTVLNYAGFFALHFPVVRFPFSHRHVIETNVQNLNIASRILLAPAWWYSPLRAWTAARSDAHSRPRAGRRTGHSSPALLPRRAPRPTRRQVRTHLRGSRPPSPPRAAAACALAAPAIARPEPRRDASAPGTTCALRRAPGGRQERAGGGHAAPRGTRLPWIGPPPCV